MLCLPFQEFVVENVINNLLFKYQGKHCFLLNFEQNLRAILELPDAEDFQETMFQAIFGKPPGDFKSSKD